LRLGAEWETATLHLSAARYWFELDDGWGIPLGAETGSSDAGRYSLSDLDALWRHGRFHLDPQRMLDRDTAIVRNPAGDRLFAGRPHPR
jgi:hypothetical protein